MIQPDTLFASIGDDRIAYQVCGNGPRDLVHTSGLWGHLDVQWEDPSTARMLRRMAGMGRLIRFDRRGTGLSDRAAADGKSIDEHWVDDCLAVLDAVKARAPIFISAIDSGPLVLEFVDRHPDRCAGLVFVNTFACLGRRDDYPEGLSPQTIEGLREFFGSAWGNPAFGTRWVPSMAGNPPLLQWYAKFQRSMASPRSVVENFDLLSAIDARSALARVRVPTLVMGRRNLSMIGIEQVRYIAEHISGARFIELPGSDGSITWETPELILDHIEEFITGMRRGAAAERALAAVLFTDIVDSTATANALGDAAWRRLLDQHDRLVREHIALFEGRLVEVTGDGTLATFAGPGPAIDCASALQAELASLGLRIRAGLHLGEVELREDGRIGGLAVHIAARVLALAGSGEVLVSRTVHDVLIGSRHALEARGTHVLKGVPGQWAVYAAKTGD